MFNDSPARRGQFTLITGSKIFPLKYCRVRWLENGVCVERALKIFDDLKKFVTHPSINLPKTKPIENVQSQINDKLLTCKLAFFKTLFTDCDH